MSERFPTHPKFPLVLKLWQFGEEGGNGAIKSINKLNKLTGVSHVTIRSWKQSGWLDMDMNTIAKIVRGDISEDDLKRSENGEIDLESFENGTFDRDIETEKQHRDENAKQKEEYTDELLKDILMTESEIASNIKPDEDVQGRRTPKRVTLKEFPASDLVFHDIKFYEKAASYYGEKNHNQFMREQVQRIRKVVDISGSQLENLIEEGRIGSKSATSAFGLVKDGLGLLSRFQKEIFDEDNTVKLTPTQRKERLVKQRERISRSIEESKNEDAKEDKIVATASSRLKGFRSQMRSAAESSDLDAGDIEE